MSFQNVTSNTIYVVDENLLRFQIIKYTDQDRNHNSYLYDQNFTIPNFYLNSLFSDA